MDKGGWQDTENATKLYALISMDPMAATPRDPDGPFLEYDRQRLFSWMCREYMREEGGAALWFSSDRSRNTLIAAQEESKAVGPEAGFSEDYLRAEWRRLLMDPTQFDWLREELSEAARPLRTRFDALDPYGSYARLFHEILHPDGPQDKLGQVLADLRQSRTVLPGPASIRTRGELLVMAVDAPWMRGALRSPVFTLKEGVRAIHDHLLHHGGDTELVRLVTFNSWRWFRPGYFRPEPWAKYLSDWTLSLGIPLEVISWDTRHYDAEYPVRQGTDRVDVSPRQGAKPAHWRLDRWTPMADNAQDQAA